MYIDRRRKVQDNVRILQHLDNKCKKSDAYNLHLLTYEIHSNNSILLTVVI